jgi:hypothetical protein
MGRRRRVGSQRRNAGLAGFVLLALGVLAFALLLGFLLGRIADNREEAAPPLPPARGVTVEETVRAPGKTVPATTATTSASATAPP